MRIWKGEESQTATIEGMRHVYKNDFLQDFILLSAASKDRVLFGKRKATAIWAFAKGPVNIYQHSRACLIVIENPNTTIESVQVLSFS